MADKVFVDGVITKIITTQYGEIIKLGVKVEEFKKFLETHEEKGWVNMNLMTSKDGDKKYLELDTWKPDGQQAKPKSNDTDSIPF